MILIMLSKILFNNNIEFKKYRKSIKKFKKFKKTIAKFKKLYYNLHEVEKSGTKW